MRKFKTVLLSSLVAGLLVSNIHSEDIADYDVRELKYSIIDIIGKNKSLRIMKLYQFTDQQSKDLVTFSAYINDRVYLAYNIIFNRYIDPEGLNYFLIKSTLDPKKPQKTLARIIADLLVSDEGINVLGYKDFKYYPDIWDNLKDNDKESDNGIGQHIHSPDTLKIAIDFILKIYGVEHKTDDLIHQKYIDAFVKSFNWLEKNKECPYKTKVKLALYKTLDCIINDYGKDRFLFQNLDKLYNKIHSE